MKTEGYIFTYNDYGSIAYSSLLESSKNIIFIDGMGGNILSIPYFTNLKDFCADNNINFIVPQLRSHPNYTIFPIESDIEDIKNLVDKVNGKIILIGHSTGCQDVLLYIQEHMNNKISGVILQAPVSDVESNQDLDLKKHISNAENSYPFYIYEGRAWLSERFVSCYKEHGKEDLFSSYLEDKEFLKWKEYCPILSVLSGKDEFSIMDLRDKFKLMGKVGFITEGDHSLSENAAKIEFISIVSDFLKEIKFIEN